MILLISSIYSLILNLYLFSLSFLIIEKNQHMNLIHYFLSILQFFKIIGHNRELHNNISLEI